MIKNEAEIAIMKENATTVSKMLAEVAKVLKPGVTTLQIDKLCAELVAENKGVPTFLNFNGYPYSCCTSVNDQVVHGFPNDRELVDGDILSIDLGITKNGYVGEHAYSFIIGEASDELLQLVRVTKESLYKGIEKAINGNRVGDISYAIEEHTNRKYGYGVVRELVGHGLGKTMHEDPYIPNYGRRGSGTKLRENLTIAIEPMINMGTRQIYIDDDGWTVHTADKMPAVHFEHDVCVKKNKALILSDYSVIEEAELANPNLNTGYFKDFYIKVKDHYIESMG